MRPLKKYMLYLSTEIIYGILICGIYAIICSGQVLGFIGHYEPLLVIFVTPLIAIITFIIYHKASGGKYVSKFLIRETSAKFSNIDLILMLSTICMLIFIIILPLLRWPESPIARQLQWDAAAYHFPKAIELYKNGSFWDLSIPYGQYPNGYESLLSFFMIFSGDETYFGLASLL